MFRLNTSFWAFDFKLSLKSGLVTLPRSKMGKVYRKNEMVFVFLAMGELVFKTLEYFFGF